MLSNVFTVKVLLSMLRIDRWQAGQLEILEAGCAPV